ncbi:MAG: hypothetical protein ACJ77A_17995 [Actinomycetota bacterium]
MSEVSGSGGQLARAREALRPIGRTLFSEPFEQGRLRIAGVPAIERQLGVGAIVVLAGMLLVLLVGDAFRQATLARLNDLDDRWTFVPLTLLPFAVVALVVGWLVFLWGAMRGTVWVALAGGVVHLLVNGTIGRVSSGGLTESTISRIGPAVDRAGYFAVFGVVVVFALVNLRPSWGRRARYVALPLLAGSLAAMYGAVLLLALENITHGFPALASLVLGDNVDGISTMLQPMILLSAVVLVDFSYNVATAATAPGLELRGGVVKAGLAVLIAVKLWFELVSHLGEWGTYARVSVAGVVWVVVSAVAFAGVGLWWRSMLRRRRLGESGEERIKERIIFIGIAAEVLAPLIVNGLNTAASAVFTQTNSQGALRFIDSTERFVFRNSVTVRAIPWVVLLLLGVWLVLRGRTSARRELGLGLFLLGAWNSPFYVLAAFGIRFQYSNPLLDIVVTTGIAVVLLARWRHIDRFEAVALAVLTVFSWVAFTRGDFISAIVSGPLAFLGLTSAAVVVFGIVYTLLADSAVTSASTRQFPRESRLLLFLGFLVLSTTVLAWIEITHPVSNLQFTVSANGFSDIGIPFAAWLIIRRPVTRREAAETALPSEAAAFEVDDREPPPAPTFHE